MPSLSQQFKLLENGDAPAVMDLTHSKRRQRWTYASLSRQVEKAATHLLSIGVQKGTVVAISLENSIEFIIAFLAVAHIGAVALPLNVAYKAPEFTFYLEDSKAKYFIVGSVGNLVTETVANEHGVSLIEITIDQETNEVALFDVGKHSAPVCTIDSDPYVPQPSDVCLILHTSGTTSIPKAVPLTHENVCTSVVNIVATYELSNEDITYLVMPLFHVHGLICGVLATLASGGLIVIPKGGKFSATGFWDDVVSHQVTWYTAVPTIHHILLLRSEADYPSTIPPVLRFIRSSSAPLVPSVLLKLESTFNTKVLEAYGMTEAAHQIASNPLKGNRKPGTVGVGQNVQIAILDEKDNLLPPGKVGEICVKGRNVTSGYLNNAEVNKKAFSNGWFHTGDQGVTDDEGYVKLMGRFTEIINRGGMKINPIEVDNALLSHVSVGEVVTFPAPDEKYGEIVNAVVVLVPESFSTKEELLAFCRTVLADYKVPDTLFIAQSIPRSATGKIQRKTIADFFLNKPH